FCERCQHKLETKEALFLMMHLACPAQGAALFDQAPGGAFPPCHNFGWQHSSNGTIVDVAENFLDFCPGGTGEDVDSAVGSSDIEKADIGEKARYLLRANISMKRHFAACGLCLPIGAALAHFCHLEIKLRFKRDRRQYGCSLPGAVRASRHLFPPSLASGSLPPENTGSKQQFPPGWRHLSVARVRIPKNGSIGIGERFAAGENHRYFKLCPQHVKNMRHARRARRCKRMNGR